MTDHDPHRWLKDFPSTQATVFVGLVLATFYVIVSLVGALVGREIGEATHFALATFITALIGVNFAVKRFSDRELAAAKATGPSPVTVEAPSTVVTPAPETKTFAREDRRAVRNELPSTLPESEL